MIQVFVIISFHKRLPSGSFLLYTIFVKSWSSFIFYSLVMEKSDKQNSEVVVSPTKDGQWEVRFYDLPYPKNANPLAIAIYSEIYGLIEAHYKQLLGKVLTFIDAIDAPADTLKARKDILKEIIHKSQENQNVDLVNTCGQLDEWINWFKDNFDIKENANIGSTMQNPNFLQLMKNI